MSLICGEFKFATESNYRQFLETMGAPNGMIDKIMASLADVINKYFIAFLRRIFPPII